MNYLRGRSRASLAVHARQLARYVHLEMLVEESLVEAEPRSRVWQLGHRAHVDHQREVVVVFLDAGVPVVHVRREDGTGGCGGLVVVVELVVGELVVGELVASIVAFRSQSWFVGVWQSMQPCCK